MKHHGIDCTNGDWCDFCESLAEDHAGDWEPDYDLSAAATQYERSLGL